MRKKKTKRKAKKKVRAPVNIPRSTLLRWIRTYVPLQEMLKIPWMEQELIRRRMATRKHIAVVSKLDLDELYLLYLLAG
jgi:hypothetical protein